MLIKIYQTDTSDTNTFFVSIICNEWKIKSANYFNLYPKKEKLGICLPIINIIVSI